MSVKKPMHRWQEITDRLRQRPGEWERVADYRSLYTARGTAYHIRVGRLAGTSPAGSFEAEGRLAVDGAAVYARYVGEAGS